MSRAYRKEWQRKKQRSQHLCQSRNRRQKKVETKEQEVPVLKKEEEPETEENHTGRILEMRKKGMQSVEIAKALGVGLGEVNLVLGLYKGDTDS
ncbi:DUF6115 domain-containing protein [Roseburia intestinalis]|uniref:DUF6115 domain-containing protein n=1 Tax=Roseburia intestinalis TaxID=166486 RepID=UPI003A7F3EE3